MIKVTEGVGFFSCISVRLSDIVHFINKVKNTNTIISFL